MGNVRGIAADAAAAIVERLTGRAPEPEAVDRRPSTGRTAHDGERPCSEAEFWVAVAFVIFVGIVWKVGGGKALIGGLDTRAERIRAELAEARAARGGRSRSCRFRAPAQRGRSGGRRHRRRGPRRGRAHRQRGPGETRPISSPAAPPPPRPRSPRPKPQAAAEVRAAAADAAVRASEVVLRGQLAGAAAEALVAKGLADVKRKLNG